MGTTNSIYLLDRLEFALNLLKGLGYAIESLEDSDAVNGLTAVLIATQSCLGEAIEAIASTGQSDKEGAYELAV